MKVVVVGAGLGGLACAIACRREGVDVVVLERAEEILPASLVHPALTQAHVFFLRKQIHSEY
jgi:flavin-dependent dehydrogenase